MVAVMVSPKPPGTVDPGRNGPGAGVLVVAPATPVTSARTLRTPAGAVHVVHPGSVNCATAPGAARYVLKARSPADVVHADAGGEAYW